jgi:hypothetical protein
MSECPRSAPYAVSVKQVLDPLGGELGAVVALHSHRAPAELDELLEHAHHIN